MPRILDHIDLRVRSMETCAAFYRGLLPALGFTEEASIEGWLQFEAAGAGVTEFFGVIEDPSHRPNRNRIAFAAESQERLDALAALLPGMGALNLDGPEFIEPYYYAVYFDDPSGNPLEICFRTRKFSDS